MFTILLERELPPPTPQWVWVMLVPARRRQARARASRYSGLATLYIYSEANHSPVLRSSELDLSPPSVPCAPCPPLITVPPIIFILTEEGLEVRHLRIELEVRVRCPQAPRALELREGKGLRRLALRPRMAMSRRLPQRPHLLAKGLVGGVKVGGEQPRAHVVDCSARRVCEHGARLTRAGLQSAQSQCTVPPVVPDLLAHLLTHGACRQSTTCSP